MDKRHLSKPNRWLIERGQHVNFGSVTFYMLGGEPDLNRAHRTARTIKLAGGSNGPRPEAGLADFELRKEHIELLAQLKMLPDGTCVQVKFAHGLPGSSFDILEDHRAA